MKLFDKFDEALALKCYETVMTDETHKTLLEMTDTMTTEQNDALTHVCATTYRFGWIKGAIFGVSASLLGVVVASGVEIVAPFVKEKFIKFKNERWLIKRAKELSKAEKENNK